MTADPKANPPPSSPCPTPLRVLVVPDKFKGTLTAQAAATHIAAGWHRQRPADFVECVPMSDGGDGFGAVLGHLLGAKEVGCESVDAANRPRLAFWWWDPTTSTAIVETAQSIGLAHLPPEQFHPFQLDTRGLAPLFRAAAQDQAKHVLVGIGGSATNDAGFGLAHALGWRFLDATGQPLTRWTELDRLRHLEPPISPLPLPNVTVAVDVRNPLLGPQGATRIYGPQKGIRPSDFARAEACLERLATCWLEQTGQDLASVPGAGAAGGLGFGLLAFLQARLQPGFDLFATTARLPTRIQNANLVISGEGSIDQSTLMGKGVGGVANLCQQLHVPCLGLAGVLGNEVAPSHPAPFAALYAIAPELAPPAEARAHAGHWLEAIATLAAANLPAILARHPVEPVF